MKSPLIFAVMMLASPAMAGESILYWQPPTPIEQLTIQVRELKTELTVLKQKMDVSGVALAKPEATAETPPTADLSRRLAAPEPVAKAGALPRKSKPRACPVLKGNQKCKRGRTQSPKHNCKCGVWS